MLEGQRIVVTGPASQVALPLVRVLSVRNEVFGVARFGREADREAVDAAGATPIAADLAEDLGAVPRDVDSVLHFAVVKSGDWEYDLRANAEGSARLLAHCRGAKAFLHVSSTAVYAYQGHEPLGEGAALGDNHRAMFPTYSIAKIAAETSVRFAAREFGVPTTIARLSVPYGNNGGWPWWHLMMMKSGAPITVHPDAPNVYHPLHEDDYIAHIPKLLGAATTPATTVNWGGSEAVSIEDWTAYLTELTGLEAKLTPDPNAFGSLQLDLTRMHALLGETKVPWRDGIRRMVEARNPELLG